MLRSVLVIVPHQDDELNIIGTQIPTFLKDDTELSIVFVTNGDFYPEKTKRRIKESNDIVNIIGVKNVFYLGYGDKLKKYHIYDTKCSDDVVESNSGMVHTYGIGPSVDYSMLYTGKHSPYNLKFLKRDLRACMEMVNPSIIICNDYDNHVDHKMVSILVDEIVGEIVKDNNDYYPLLLKKYAYAGVWDGPNDYFYRPMIDTKIEDTQNSIDGSICLYDDFQKIMLKVDEKNYPLCYWKSPMFMLLKKYKSQKAVMRFPQIVNSDDVFFYRTTHNLALKAHVSVSSGNGSYLNDYKIIDTTNIRSSGLENSVDCCTWIPGPNDKDRTIVVSFDKVEIINSVILYQSFDSTSVVKSISISSDNEYQKDYILSGKKIEKIMFQPPLKATYLSIQLLDCIGAKAGFREIELINNESEEKDRILLNSVSTKTNLKGRKRIIFDSLFTIDMFIRFRLIPAVSRRVPMSIKYFFDDYERTATLIKECCYPILGMGVCLQQRRPRIIVSLTSYPKRFNTLHYTVKSIMHQSFKPDKIVLYLGDDSKKHALPQKILDLVPHGLEIKYVEGNIGSYKKFYYAYKEYPDDIIVTIDDDLLYEKRMLQLLIDSYHRFPQAISAKRVHRLRKSKNGVLLDYNNWDYEYEYEEEPSHELIATTGGGTLFPPHIFGDTDYDINAIYELAPYSDDIWIKFLALKNDVKVVFVKGKWIMPKESIIDRSDSLRITNCLDGGNDISISNLEKYMQIDLAKYACWHE